MNIFQAILLGIVQGITEFLPISSSAHLVIVPYLLGWNIPPQQIFPFDVLVQLGTLFSLVIYFRKDVLELINSFINGIKTRQPFMEVNSRLSWFLLLATVPAGLAGLFFKDFVEKAFRNPVMTAFFLFGTAFLLVIAEVIGKRSLELSQIKWQNALVVGVFQALSIFPGISRSGACIGGGMLQNFTRRDAGRFAFLMAIPVMLSAGLLGIVDLLQVQNMEQFLPVLLTGLLVSAVVGYFVIHWLLQFLNQHTLFPFAIYCLSIGVLILGLNYVFPQNLFTASTASSSYQTIYYDSSLEWIIPYTYDCHSSNSDSRLNFVDRSSLPDDTSDAYQLVFPSSLSASGFSYLLGYEDLLVVVNNANPLTQLTHQQLQKIFNGEYPTWADFIADCPQCGSLVESADMGQGQIQTWVYSEDSSLQQAINDYLFVRQQLVTSYLAPSSQAMQEALQINPAAIGFLPSHWLDSSLKAVTITDTDLQDLQLPIIAISPTEPDETIKSFFLCIQSFLEGG